MLRRYALIILCISLAAACSKKLPEAAKAIPADADLVATLDAKTTLAYAKQAITKAVPAEHKDKVPGVEMILKKAVEMTGIDLDKLGKVTYIGWLGSQEQMAFIAEGVEAKSLKGKKQGAHNGVDIYAAEMIRYAQLGKLGTLAAPSDAVLKKVLDAHAGKAKCIADTDRADVLEKLLEVEKDHDQLRVYVLTGKIPGEMPLPYKIKGGGFFLHVDRGATATVVAEQNDAKEIKNKVDMGMMVMQMALAAGGQDMGLPVEIDQATQKSVIDMLKNIKTRQKGEIVTIGYKGDLKPLIDKAIALGIQQTFGEEDALPPADDIAKVPPVPAAPPPPPPAKK
jgi:hypothetical protein